MRLRAAFLVVPLLASSVVPSSAATPAWKWRLAVPAPPPARASASMAYDEATRQVVLFTASNTCGATTACGATWIWDGERWSEAKAPGPPARSNAAMVYDAASRKVLLFGGNGTAGALGDTWLWDGTKWTAFTTGSQPAARSDAGIAYDAATRKVVLFGGSASGSVLGDTWIWTGGEGWAQLTPPNATDAVPPGRARPGMVYDAGRREVVLFGGTGTNSGTTTDATTWVLPSSRNGWVAATATGPAPRRDAGMVYDAAHRQVLMVGAYGTDLGSQTWVWDGTRWTKVNASLTSRFNPALVADPACGCVVLLGGLEGSGVPMADSWRWDGQSWHALVPKPNAYWSGQSEMVYDGKTKQVVAFGGIADQNGTFFLGETWVWDHHRGWAAATKNGPPRSANWRVVYDPARRQLVAFQHTFFEYNETWVWNGHAWSLASDIAPPDDATFSQAPIYSYDVAARQLVTFFGKSTSFTSGVPTPGKTMLWTGRRWSSSTGTQPPTFSGAAIAYDEARRQVVLVSAEGCKSTGLLGTGTGPDLDNGTAFCTTTSTWNGSRWTRHAGSQPPARTYGLMAYDAAHHTVVLFGGTDTGRSLHEATLNYNGSTQALTDTWLWNGTKWTEVHPAHVPPSAGYSGSLTYDPATHRVVLFGAPVDNGRGGTNPSGTWVWNGTDWTDATTKDGPAGNGSLVYDSAFGHLLLVGAKVCALDHGIYGKGVGPDFSNTLGACGIWSWDGRAWQRAPGAIAAPDSAYVTYAYDDATRQVVTVTNDGVWTWGKA